MPLWKRLIGNPVFESSHTNIQGIIYREKEFLQFVLQVNGSPGGNIGDIKQNCPFRGHVKL